MDLKKKKKNSEILSKKRKKLNKRNIKKTDQKYSLTFGGKKIENCDSEYENRKCMRYDIDNEYIGNGRKTTENENGHENENGNENENENSSNNIRLVVNENESCQDQDEKENEVNSFERAQIVQMILSTARPLCKKCVRDSARLGVRADINVIAKNDIEIEIQPKAEHRQNVSSSSSRMSGSSSRMSSSSSPVLDLPLGDVKKNIDENRPNSEDTNKEQNTHFNTKNVLYGLHRCREILERNSDLLPRYLLSPLSSHPFLS